MLVGRADIDTFAAKAPTIRDLAREGLTLEGVRILQGLFEITGPEAREGLLLPGLHPTNPPYVTFVFYEVDDSPIGGFTLAQLRIGCRSGARPRGFLYSSFIDNEDAGQELAERFGYNPQLAEVRLHRGYDSILGSVMLGDEPILLLEGSDPDPLAPHDIQYSNNMNLAHTDRGLRLVQIDPDFTIHRAERVNPRLRAFDGEAWGNDEIDPYYPVSGSLTTADVAFPQLRYLCRPDILAFQGTEVINRD